MKKVVCLIIGIAVILSLVLGGCAAPTPTPTPTPAPTPTPTPTPTPAPQPEVKIEVMGGSFAAMSYLMGFATADILSRYHPWIKATATETFGSDDNIIMMAEDKKSRIAYCKEFSVWNAWVGKEPYFKKAYPDVKFVANMNVLAEVMITLDPNIKGPEDIVGKKISSGTGTHRTMIEDLMLDAAWGVLDKVEVVSGMGYRAAEAALADGKLDVIHGSVTPIGGGKFITVGGYEALFKTRDVYFVGLTKEDIRKMGERSGLPVGGILVPAGATGVKTQTEPFYGIAMSNMVICFAEMDEELVYEITKTLVENAERFKVYYGGAKGTTAELLPLLPIISEDEIHPGALKYYKEHGMKIGF